MYKTELDSSSNVALVTRIYCKGSEDSIEECNIASHYTKASTCGIHDIIGVKCQSNPLIMTKYLSLLYIHIYVHYECVLFVLLLHACPIVYLGNCLVLCNLFYTAVEYNYFGYRVF